MQAIIRLENTVTHFWKRSSPTAKFTAIGSTDDSSDWLPIHPKFYYWILINSQRCTPAWQLLSTDCSATVSVQSRHLCFTMETLSIQWLLPGLGDAIVRCPIGAKKLCALEMGFYIWCIRDCRQCSDDPILRISHKHLFYLLKSKADNVRLWAEKTKNIHLLFEISD